MKKKISIIIPAFNEQGSISDLLSKIRNECKVNNYTNIEVICVDDGSSDNTAIIAEKKLKELKIKSKILSFKTNHGKSVALNEGFNNASGDIIITMDADLQDDPKEIVNFVNKIEEGFDLVSGWKFIRNDPYSKTIPSKFFNFITSKVSGIRLHDFNCGFKAYTKDLAKELNLYGEHHRYIPIISHNLGYKITEIKVKHHPRKYDSSKYGIERYLRGFFDLFTVLFLNNYKSRPLHLFGSIGLLFICFGFFIEFYLVFKWFLGFQIGMRPLFFLGILLLIVGIQSFFFGLIGEMIARKNNINVKYSIKKFY